eukprot:403345025
MAYKHTQKITVIFRQTQSRDLAKQPKSYLKLENGLILVNLKKLDINCEKRIYNLKNSNTHHRPKRSRSTIVKTLNHKNLTTDTQTNFNGNLQASEIYLRNNKLPQQQQTTFVKIGNEYEAIKNEFSLSQIKNQKDVQKLFEISMSLQQNGYVRVKPLNQNMWVYQNQQDYLPISKGAIVNLAGSFFQIKSIRIPKIMNDIDQLESIDQQDQTLNSFIDTSLLQEQMLSKYIQNKLSSLDRTCKSDSKSKTKLRQNVTNFKTQDDYKNTSIRQSIQSCRICFNNQYQVTQLMQMKADQNINNNQVNLRNIGEDNNQMMIQPCQCKGSIGNIHFKCMKRWIDTKIKDQIDMKNQVIDMDIFRCDICKVQS